MVTPTPNSLTELPRVVDVPDQPCQQLYDPNPVLLGFDVVQYHFIPSYHEGGIAQQGLSEFAYNFMGYQFWFISNENRQLFINDPWKYAPAWGGFCSWGIALETKPQWPWDISFLGPPASPWEGWAIVDGVLIFNIWSDYTDRFLRNVDENMKLAAERWKAFFNGQLHAGPFNTHCIGHGRLQNWCLTQQPSPWLQPLPECTTVIVVDEASGNITNITKGGGIVSELGNFDDFTNSGLSPYQRKWIISGAVVLPVIFLLLVGLLYHFFKHRCFQPARDDDSSPSGINNNGNNNNNNRIQKQEHETKGGGSNSSANTLAAGDSSNDNSVESLA